jgi:hypothetical protein
MLIEAMHARVFSTALKEDVVTILGPGCCERGVNDGASMALTSKFGMTDHVFEKAVPPSGPQQIWCRDKHAGCNDLRVRGGYEDCDAVVGQHFQPNSLGSLHRLRTAAYFCQSIEFEQRSKVGNLSKPGIGHLNTGLRIAASLFHLGDSSRRDGFDLDHEIRTIQL